MIGYNVAGVKSLIEKISQNYTQLDRTIVTKWDTLVKTLRREWIGYDEQDYEKKFAKKLAQLSSVSSQVVNLSMTAMSEVANVLHEQEMNNTLNGERLANVPQLKLDVKKVNPIAEGELTAGGLEFGPNVTKGIKNGKNSAAILHNSVQDFVKTIEQKSRALADSINTNNAFFGGFSASIKKYLEKCTEATAVVATSVADLDQALKILVGDKATSIEDTLSEVFNQAATNVDKAVDDISTNRWE